MEVSSGGLLSHDYSQLKLICQVTSIRFLKGPLTILEENAQRQEEFVIHLRTYVVVHNTP